MRRLISALFLIAVVGVLAGCPKPNPGAGSVEKAASITPTKAGEPSAPAASGPQRTIKIYVPCGLILPLREAGAKFSQSHPDIKVDGKFDNAITLAKLIRDKGDRPDLYVSPGTRELGLCEEKGLIDESTKTTIGEFDLVVIVPKDNPKNIHSLQDLTKADVISCPDPKSNSVGMYGEQALRKAGLWDKLMPKGDEKMIFTEKAIQSHEHVVAGKADAGIAFKNCPLETNPEKLKKGSVLIACDVDHSLYDKPLCLVAMLKDAPHPADAKVFLAYLQTPEAKKVMADNGMQTFAPAAGSTPASASAPAPAAAGGAVVKVEAFYPDNSDHGWVKQLVKDLNAKYPGKVHAEFIDFTSDAGYKRWRAAGLSCGSILINGKQSYTVPKKEKMTEVTFEMKEGGEWTKADLDYVITQALAKAGKK